MSILDSWRCTRPIAHRGLHNEAMPENSLGAFENAIAHGYPIELDVRTIGDGSVVVFHDGKLSRMSGLDGYVSTLEPEKLGDIHLFGTEYTIPTFEKVLEIVNGRVPILIEIKNEDKVGGLEKSVAEILNAYTGEYAVQSFNPYSLGYFASSMPHVMRGQLSTFFKKEELAGYFRRVFLTKMKLNKSVSKPDFVSYNAEFLPNKYVTRAALPTLAWTVRSSAQADKLAPYCNNIIFEKFIPEIKK